MRTLDRYILVELLKTLVLTTTVLVTVVAFGAAIKPLAEDQLLSPAHVAKYVVLAVIPMLQFALPFGAGFAATLTMHRLATDNEILAMSTAGLSYRRVFAPVVGLSLALLLVMLVLTQAVIPRFWQQMHATLPHDATKIFEASIRRGEPFQVGNVQIYAKELLVQEDPADTGADTRLILLRGAAAELDGLGRVSTDVTFRQAVVDVYRDGGRTLLKLVMLDTVSFDGAGSSLVRAEQIAPENPFVFRDVAKEDLAAMTVRDLRALHDDPNEYSDVVEACEILAARLFTLDAYAEIRRQLEEQEAVTLMEDADDRYQFVVRCDRLTNGRFINRDGSPILVDQVVDGAVVRQFRPNRAELQRATSTLADGSARFDLELFEVAVEQLGTPEPTRESLLFPQLAIPGITVSQYESLLPDELVALATTGREAGPGLEKLVGDVHYEIQHIRDEITSRLSKRNALAATAPLLLVLGGLLAVLKKHSLPLTIYLWAFLPSLGSLIVISSGDHVYRDGDFSGWFILWSGNAGLLVMAGLTYLRLARN